jgi:hypothetical protein
MTDSLTRSRRVRAAVAVAGVAALALTACSGGDDPPPAGRTRPSNLVTPLSQSSPGATAPAGMPSGIPTAVPAGGAQVAAATLATTISAAATRQRTVAFDVLSGGAQDIAGSGVAKGSGTSSQVKIEARVSGSSLGIVKTGSTVYFRTPAPIRGKAWLKVSENSADPLSKIYAQAFLGLDNAADVPRVATFVAKMGRFTRAATEPVDGVATTKYVGQPPAATALPLMSGPYQQLATSGSLAGAKTVVSLWIDEAGLLRRTAVVFTLRDVPPVQSLVEYKKWGQPVTVQAPPAGEVLTPAAPSP